MGKIPLTKGCHEGEPQNLGKAYPTGELLLLLVLGRCAARLPRGVPCRCGPLTPRAGVGEDVADAIGIKDPQHSLKRP
jgi:hypothetical protein